MSGFQSFLTAVVIALFGLLPLGLMAMSTSEPQLQGTDTVATTTAAPGSGSLPIARRDAGDEWARSVITTPTPTIAGVSDEVARVLAANGFAGEEIVEGIPDSVVRVLTEHGAVLTVAVSEGG